MPQYHAWQQNDVFVTIYKQGDFELQQLPILQLCYSESCSVDGALEAERRPRTAQSTREIVASGAWDDWVLGVSSLYYRKDVDLNQAEIMNRTKRLDILLLYHSVIADRPDESHWFKGALATSFRKRGSDNEVTKWDITFLGKEFV